MSSKFHISTFGCRTNQADSAALRDDLLRAAYDETLDARDADLIVVNSCTVTHRTDQQVRQLVRRLRRENSNARLVVTGCFAQRDAEAVARIGGVDAVVGNTHKERLVELESALSQDPIFPARPGEMARIFRDDFSKARSIGASPATPSLARTRPFLKIQDGCDAKCSYCIIPSVRGPSRSVAPGEILAQTRNLVRQGFQEIVLTGIHLGTYGIHLRPRFPLYRLLEQMLAIRGVGRIRISSIEPMELSRQVIRLAASSQGRIAPHFHICLQSGCDATLKRMLRPYTTARFADIVAEIRSSMPEAAIGSDVIVGFPGESRSEHRESLDFVNNMPFTYLHVFPYSDRSGTRASQMSEKVLPREIKRRSLEMRRISDRKNREFRRGFIGAELSAITLDEVKDSQRSVLTGNYLKAQVSPRVPPNRILDFRVAGEKDGMLMLEISERPSGLGA